MVTRKESRRQADIHFRRVLAGTTDEPEVVTASDREYQIVDANAKALAEAFTSNRPAAIEAIRRYQGWAADGSGSSAATLTRAGVLLDMPDILTRSFGD